MHTFDHHELGRTDETVKLELREESQAAITRMAQQCSRSIDIISRDLDPDLFDTAEFLDAVRAMILNNRRARVRLLVMDPKKIVSKGHRMVELARTLSSFIEFRVPSAEHRDFNEMLMVADNTGYLHRLNPDRFEATVNFNDKLVSKHLMLEFDEMWSKSTTDSNLRKLTI